MKIRFVILLVVFAGVLGVAMIKTDKPKDTGGPTFEEEPVTDGPIKYLKNTLDEIDLPGQDPPKEPEIDVVIEFRDDNDLSQKRVYMTISERNGYFVETFRILIYYSPNGFIEDDGVYIHEFYLNYFLSANEPLTTYTALTPPEVNKLSGDFTKKENWRGVVHVHGRARVENPDPSWIGYKVKKPNM